MKKGSFIVGTIFLVLTLACCIFANIVTADNLKIAQSNSLQGLALIMTIPLALLGYICQAVTGAVSFGCFVGCWASESKKIKILSIVFAAIVGVLIVFSVIFFVTFEKIANSGTEDALLSYFFRA